MERIVDRFISYTRIDTTSHDADTVPSTPNQWLLARQLEGELKELGLQDVHIDEHAFVYATLPSNTDHKCDTVGFLAHMDTSDATSGADIKTRIIENYDGQDIVLESGLVTAVSEYPNLKELKGKTLIVTDGTTLLGGDDKAGIAIIMDFLEKTVNDPEYRHGEIRICFTPDEETGGGISHIDRESFICDYAYTIDGGKISGITYENFNAASAHVTFTGNSIHPGDAKNKMINAGQLAMDYHRLLPENQRPEYTEGREGFNHLISLQTTCEKGEAYYIIRNHDLAKLEKQKLDFVNAAEFMNRQYGKEVVTLELHDAYRNMREKFEGKMYIVEQVEEAMKKLGIQPVSEPIRGGTDGASLTYAGIPTPNLGTGGYFCHGNHELVCVEEMQEMVKIITALAAIIEGKEKH